MGLAMALRFAEEGASVVLSSRKQDQVDEALHFLRQQGHSKVVGCVAHQAKASDREKLIRLAVTTFGQIDAVVLCAAVQPGSATGPTLTVESSLFDKIFDVNVKSYWEFVKDVKSSLNQSAKIVFIASTAAYNPAPPLGLYGVSKTALVALTKLLGTELGPQGIRVNCLAPGLVRTDFSSMLWKQDDSSLRHVENNSWLKRAGEPFEMAGAVAYMCSDDSSYMTGETMILGGGGPARL